MSYPKVIIREKRIASINRKHPWIFSGGILSSEDCQDGDIVEVRSRKGVFLAIGYFQEGSIMVRILSFNQVEIDADFWRKRFLAAIELRKELKIPSPLTNAYRLIHGEGDQLSGLIIDIYDSVAVIQCHTIGIHRLRNDIAHALSELLDDRLETIYIKSGNTLPAEYAASNSDYFITGKTREVKISENGCSFMVDIVGGQKTGFFLDQRENRQLLKNHVKGKKVLNLFSYSGGFSIYALAGGAQEVVSVDVSQNAIDLCDRNVALTQHSSIHRSVVADVNRYLKEVPLNYYDIIIVDPPAFAKSVRKKHNAVQAYKRINTAAINKVKTGGLIFTFSCSQVIDQTLFYHTMTAAAIESGRLCQVLYHLFQGPDHPINLFHPEGRYLKGLVLRVQ